MRQLESLGSPPSPPLFLEKGKCLVRSATILVSVRTTKAMYDMQLSYYFSRKHHNYVMKHQTFIILSKNAVFTHFEKEKYRETERKDSKTLMKSRLHVLTSSSVS